MIKRTINVDGNSISVIKVGDEDYISLTEMVKNEEGNDNIRNWMRNRNTIEYLGAWESLYNENFKGVEFDTFRKEAGLNSFNMTPKKWIEGTNAQGIISKAGSGGGTYAHKDLAFHFGMWISPIFQLYIIKEYQRLKDIESNTLNLEWNVRRLMAKVNYVLQTDAVQKHIIPRSNMPTDKQGMEYANEADLLNVALYGYTAKEWKEANPAHALDGKNMRDFSSITDLLIMSNLESLNSEMIKMNTSQEKRFKILQRMANEQRERFDKVDMIKSIKKSDVTTYLNVENLTPDEIEIESKKDILEANRKNLAEFKKLKKSN
ncbi:KilA-N domain-containing protein [Flavobacterium zhairuonense]|uniref:KilA-N domain-containing protein n=1 Tax=Flavobacterium zhairuonense TaxID=2493631 RepID=UPI001050D0A8|nr:KilA-N domain-containing protein [Flavobacterium zhairuonense]KAF2515869.1 KilA-N domain-containing protein [Flavobacterium zhairuonense]